MPGWFKDSNIDMAELASIYRTPPQGVSAKSNSNIIFNDYRQMPPQANGANNTITTASTQTLRFDDLADTGGVVGGSNSYSTGSTKGAASFNIFGAFTAHGASVVRGDGSSTSQGYMGLGAQSGSTILTGVGSFGTPSSGHYYLEGIGMVNGTIGGTLKVVVRGLGGASAPPDNAWSTIRTRIINNTGTAGTTFTANKSDGNQYLGWTSTTTGTTRIWSVGHGLGGTYSSAYGWVANSVNTVEFV